jgi:triosephosphate isomerase
MAKKCEELSKSCGVLILPIMSPLWIQKGAWLGHVDPVSVGAFTGYVSVNQAVAAGVAGSLINHSEHPIPLQKIAQTVSAAKKAGLKTVVCVKSIGQAERVLKRMKPDFLAYEPKYLIGSKTASVASERIDALMAIIGLAKEKQVGVLAGAGVKTMADIQIVVRSGAAGVLVSSSVVENSNFEDALLGLAAGFKV